MKRILKRMWDYNYKFYPAATGLGVVCGFIILAVFSHLIRPMLSASDSITNAVDPIHATNGLVLPEGCFFVTNYCATNLTNYWFETDREIKQWYNSNYTTVEWVGKIVTADTSDPRKNPFSYLRDCELGLRSDGIVVWREKK